MAQKLFAVTAAVEIPMAKRHTLARTINPAAGHVIPRARPLEPTEGPRPWQGVDHGVTATSYQPAGIHGMPKVGRHTGQGLRRSPGGAAMRKRANDIWRGSSLADQGTARPDPAGSVAIQLVRTTCCAVGCGGVGRDQAGVVSGACVWVLDVGSHRATPTPGRTGNAPGRAGRRPNRPGRVVRDGSWSAAYP
jgi:hypothetical protein